MARARTSLPVPLSPVMQHGDVGPRDFPRQHHQLAHAARDHRVVVVGRQFVDRPQRQPFLTFGVRALQIVHGAEEHGDRR